MNRNPLRVIALFATLAVLALGLAGCGGDEPATAATPPAPPPAPPPFQPEAVEVALGESGGTVTLMTTEAGGFTLNGEAFEGGAENPVEGEGGRMYALTLADGAWTAAFVPMEVTVALGNSEESVTLTTVEAGGYTMGGEAFASGGTATSSAGAEYTLTMGEDGTWTAMFAPMTRSVPLGNSGMSVELVSNEAGMWTVGGAALKGDGTDTYMSEGRTYSLAMEDGAWTAAFVPMTQDVPLGNSGDTVTLMTVESGGWAMGDSSVADGIDVQAPSTMNDYTLSMGADGRWMAAFKPKTQDLQLGDTEITLMSTETGGWTMNGRAVQDGYTAMNSAGESYSLSMGDDGWMAMHMPRSQPVKLGASEMTVTLMSTEAGAWTMNGELVGTGATVEGGTNAATGQANMYTLTLDPDTGDWSADYDAMAMPIGGTGLEAMAREDGSGYTVGETMSLDADGMGDITDPDGGMFRVMMDADGMLTGLRYDMDMANDALHVNAGNEYGPPTLISDDRKTDFNEKNTMLSAVGEDFSIGELLGGGAATETGDNIVAKALGEITKIRNRVAQLVALRADDGIESGAFETQIGNQWDAADTQIQTIFGGDGTLERTLSASRVVDAFDRLVDALSSEEDFAAATLANGPDKLQGFTNRTAKQASEAFNRLKSTATARLGVLGSTRFGAAVWNQTGNATAAYGTAERAQAFAWSTMDNIRRATDMTASGEATYAGQTMAADQAGNLYSGTINLSVRITRMAVDGFVTGLARADTQAPWTHGLGGEVVGIHFPTATLQRGGSWSVTGNRNNTGRLQYNPQAGGQPDLDLTWGAAGSDEADTFAGQLLGRGTDSGSESIGTWMIQEGSTMLAGSFGATRGADRAAPGTGVTDDLGTIGKRGTVFAQLEARPGPALASRLPKAAVEADPDADPPVDAMDAVEVAVEDRRQAIPMSKVINTKNAQFLYDPPVMDDAGGAEYVAGNYTPTRASVLEAEDFELDRGNWVKTAREEIEKKLNQLRRVIDLDNADASAGDRKFANDQRQRLFDEIQAEFRKVFGPGGTETDEYTGVLTARDSGLGATDRWTAHTDYPATGAGVAQDANVLNEIEDALAAMASADAFAAALDEGGVFAGARTGGIEAGHFTAASYPSGATIFNRPRGKLRMSADSTDFTRFGGWNHQVSDYAAAALKAQTYERMDRGDEFGAFAYSPLDPTAEYSTGSRLYPAQTADVTATYAGRTSAAQGDTFYTGNVEAKVFWKANAVTDTKVRLTITELEDTVNGDPLEFGYARAAFDTAGTVEVESLSWEADVTNSGVVRFNSSTDVTVKIDSLDGDPVYRPVYGSELRGANVFRHYSRSGNPDQLRIRRSASVFWVLRAGTGTGDVDYGALNFLGINATNAGDVDPTTTSGTAFDEAKAAFKAGQDTLAYPTHIINGPWVQPAGQTGTSQSRASSILLFKDGSTMTVDRWFNHNMAFIGSDANPASGFKAYNYDDQPLYSERPELLYTFYGQPWSPAFLTQDGDNGGTIGEGRPTGMDMTPARLAATFLAEGNYVNIPMGDTTARDSKVEGMFVGQDQDGPLGIIGTWELTGGAFGIGDSTQDVRGAFGADIQP